MMRLIHDQVQANRAAYTSLFDPLGFSIESFMLVIDLIRL